jgi:hypothetical protein
MTTNGNITILNLVDLGACFIALYKKPYAIRAVPMLVQAYIKISCHQESNKYESG